jgi:hypothetical protein
MSFLFALLQLVSFASADLEPTDPPSFTVQEEASKPTLSSDRPLRNPCASLGCR